MPWTLQSPVDNQHHGPMKVGLCRDATPGAPPDMGAVVPLDAAAVANASFAGARYARQMHDQCDDKKTLPCPALVDDLDSMHMPYRRRALHNVK